MSRKNTRSGEAVAALGMAAAALLGSIVAGCIGQGSGQEPPGLRAVFPSYRQVKSIPPLASDLSGDRIYIVYGRGGPLGYAVEKRVVSRSGPFTILVMIDAQLRVKRATVLSYPGERGGEVRFPTFTRQFIGKGANDPIRVGEDIDAMTGATISSQAMTDGVRAALRLVRDLSHRAPE